MTPAGGVTTYDEFTFDGLAFRIPASRRPAVDDFIVRCLLYFPPFTYAEGAARGTRVIRVPAGVLGSREDLMAVRAWMERLGAEYLGTCGPLTAGSRRGPVLARGQKRCPVCLEGVPAKKPWCRCGHAFGRRGK